MKTQQNDLAVELIERRLLIDSEDLIDQEPGIRISPCFSSNRL